MKIKTTRFGEVEVKENSYFEMINPLLGYDNESAYVLIEHGDKSKFTWLQSAKNPELAFVLTMPGLFDIDYTIELPPDTQDKLKIESVDDLLLFNIVAIPKDNPKKSTINLLAPIVFNIKNQKAAQIILSGSNYNVDYPLFKD